MVARFRYFAGLEQHSPSTLLEMAVLAEKAGFDGIACSDHFHPWAHTNAHAGFAWTWLAAVAERTKHVNVGTGVTGPLFRYHPAIVAQAFATLGVMYPNRIFLGLGSGEPLNEIPLDYHWPNEETPNTVAMELSNYPIVCWSIPSPAELISPCGLTTAASNFKHLGTKFRYVLGGIKDAKVMSRIYKLSRAASVAKKLKRPRIGVVGYNCPGMIDATFNEIEMRRLGPEVVHLSLADLIDRSAAVEGVNLCGAWVKA